jgi:ABC-type spermidine/putrescine transport system permease subunit I
MEKLIKIDTRTFAVLYILVDLICIGAGMGVPLFCILLGFPLGWYITKRIYCLKDILGCCIPEF